MRTILIIDDDIAIGNMEQEVLERAGYITRRAYSGTEALLVLKTMRPDLILLDLMLPGLSGEEISSHIYEPDRGCAMIKLIRANFSRLLKDKVFLIALTIMAAQQVHSGPQVRQHICGQTYRMHCGGGDSDR